MLQAKLDKEFSTEGVILVPVVQSPITLILD